MKRSVKILWRLFLFGTLSFVLLLLLTNWGVFGKIPSMVDLQNPEANLASEIYTSDNMLMGKFYAENRSEVKYSEISPNIINALIATEDERFFEHSGIDGQALARAVVKLGKDGGGSTLTQQLAKMILDQGHTGFFSRIFEKLKEWIVAVKLERNFTKEEIITLYLNRAAWGNVFGIRNASRTYFQKEPKDLAIEEAAVLVGMLKGFIYDPIRHKEASQNRRNTVINQMVVCREHFLTEAQAAVLKAKPMITSYKKVDDMMGIAPYFRSVLGEYLKEWCKQHKNPKTGENYDLYRDGLKIYTTINSRMQQYAEEAEILHMPVIQKKLNWNLKNRGDKLWKGHENILESAMKNSERWKSMVDDEIPEEEIRKSFSIPVKMKIYAWNIKREIDTTMTPLDSIKYHKQLMQNSFVAMDPKTGEVKCWVGGIDFNWFKYDHVTAMRQVGSTFKPLLYTLAVQDAGYTPETPVAGGSITLSGKTITGGAGTLAYCLAHSKNAAAFRLMQIIGVKRTIEFAQSCGIKAKIPPYPSIALGTAEIPMLEMLQSYTMFPNKGQNTKPILITRVEDKNGNLLQEFNSEFKQVIAETDAYTMVKLMEGVIQFGTARSLNSYNIPVKKAGKTGTTDDNTDGWFIGYTPELLAGTWVGCDDPFLKIYSGTSGGNEMAAPAWGKFMAKVYADKKLGYGKQKDFDKPVQFDNDPIYGDNFDFGRIASQSDGSKYDEGNGDATDYTNDSNYVDNTIQLNMISENLLKKDSLPVPKKKEDKKDQKPVNAAVKPGDDKNKKPKPEKTNTDGY